MPETLNTTMRAPPCSQAHRKEPGPSSLRLVTVSTFPPRPPKVYMPPPSAPGKAGILACLRSYGLAAQGTYGLPAFASSITMGKAFSQAESLWAFQHFSRESMRCFASSVSWGYCANAVDAAKSIAQAIIICFFICPCGIWFFIMTRKRRICSQQASGYFGGKECGKIHFQ